MHHPFSPPSLYEDPAAICAFVFKSQQHLQNIKCEEYETFYLDKGLNLPSKTHPLRIYTRQDTAT